MMITQPWFYLTPVIYSLPTAGILALVAKINPVTPLLVTTRELITTGNIIGTLTEALARWSQAETFRSISGYKPSSHATKSMAL